MKLVSRVFVLVIVAVFCLSALPNRAHAAFDPNRIIDDSVFNNVNTMSAASIDAFLNKYNSCISANSGFRAIDPIGYSPSTGYQYGGYVTAGVVIAHAAQAYDLNPQVLLVTLQKEQSLVTTTVNSANCNTRTISKAVGYACTDNYTPNSYSGLNLYSRNGVTYTSVDTTCVESAAKAGFTQQIIRAAWLLKFSQQRSLGNINWAIIKGSWDNSDDLQSCYSGPVTQGWRQVCPSGPTTYYDGYTTIDGTAIRPSTGATIALYRYTPHFHGNQNFVDIWTEWFGGTIMSFEQLQTVRWMQVKNDNVYKKDLATEQNVEAHLPKGMHLLLTTKITLNGNMYLRTAHDSSGNMFQGIRVSDLEEIPYQSMLYPRWMKLNRNAYKQLPRAGMNIDSMLSKGQSIHFNSKTTINGNVYLRTEHDTASGHDKGIPLIYLEDVAYENMDYPRWMRTTKATHKVNPQTGQQVGGQIAAGTQVKLNSKMQLGSSTFLRTTADTASSTDAAINMADLAENNFETMVIPRTMKLNRNSTKFNTLTTDPISAATLSLNQEIKFTSKVFVNGQWYLRSETDTRANIPYGVLLSDLSEVY